MFRRTAKVTWRLGLLVLVAFVIRKLLDTARPSAPSPRRNVEPSQPPRPTSAPIVNERPPEPELAPEPELDPEPESEPVVEPEPAVEQQREPAEPDPEPAPAPAAAALAKKPKASGASKRKQREPLRADLQDEKRERPVRANRNVPLDAERAPSRGAMVSWVEPVGAVCPTSHPIKAKLGSKVYRRPDMPGYEASRPDRCYASEGAAKRAGFTAAQR